jgi:hypothetical protein
LLVLPVHTKEVKSVNDTPFTTEIESSRRQATSAETQSKLLAILERNTRRNNILQLMTLTFGIIVSTVSVLSQIKSIFTNSLLLDGKAVYLLASSLGIGFVLIITALSLSSARDRLVEREIDNLYGDTPTLNAGIKSEQAGFVAQARAKGLRQSPLDEVRIRINRHVDRLRFFAFANIVIGSIIAAAGIAVVFALFNHVLSIGHSELRDMHSDGYVSFFILIFLPRISIVILIQIFAYFFLSMYRANLREIRYFQIELSDLELVSEAIRAYDTENFGDQHSDLAHRLFDIVKFRGNTFRLGLTSDETLETFRAMAAHGNLLSKIRSPLSALSKSAEKKEEVQD